MATIPLMVNPPPIQNPMDTFSRLMGIKAAQQQVQTGQLQQQGLQQENQIRQIQIQDQQGMRQAYIDSQGDPQKFLDNLPRYNVSFEGMQRARQNVYQMQTDLLNLNEKQFAQHQQIADLYNGFLKQVKDAPPEQRAQVWQFGSQSLQGLPGVQVPTQYPGDQALDMLGYQGVTLSKALENAKTGSETFKNQQQGNQAAANTIRLNTEMQWYQQHGLVPGVTPDTQQLASFLQNNPGKSAADYIRYKSAQEAAGRLPSQVALETNPSVIQARIGQAEATEVGKEQALAPQLPQITNTTRSGRKYINRDDIPQGSAGVVEQNAAQSGVPVVSKDTAGTLEDIDTALANQEYMLNTIGSKLAKDPTGRLYSAPANTIEKLAQTDPQLAAMGTFRNAAIQSMRAVAGSKGLRINQYEVQLAIDNDIPKMTDTLPVAQQKLKNLQAFLNNAEQSHLVRNRDVTAPGSGGWGAQFGGVRRSQ